MAREKFELKLNGPGVTPETVDVVDLYSLLVDYRRAILATAHHLGIELAEDEAVLSLVGLEEGSVKQFVSVPKRAGKCVRQVSRAVSTGDWAKCLPDAQDAMATVSGFLAKKHYELSLPPYYRERPVVMTGGMVTKSPPPLLLNGPTTLYGEVREAGGKEPHVELVLPNGQSVRVDGDRETVKKLGTVLFEPIALQGDATWDATTGRVSRFRVDSWSRFDAESVHEGFAELAAAAGNRWDNADAVKYVRQLRKVAE